jgi:TonB family protein
MNKFLLIVLLSFLTTATTFSQSKRKVTKHDSVAYYMANQYQMAYSQDGAQFLRLIIKADSGMYEIQDYYPDGTPRLLAKSYSGEMNFEQGAQGVYTEYYKNGHKKNVKRYAKGRMMGDDTTFYASGKLYNVITHDNENAFFKMCLDSTGKVLASDGNGTWVNLSEIDGRETFRGSVVNGKQEGIWMQKFAGDTATYKIEYKNGVRVGGEAPPADRQIFTAVEQQPSFGGNDNAFNMYLAKSIRYPQYARDHNITGRVIITFVVERDGRLTDFKILRSPDESLSEEALRVMKNSPVWRPGIQNGRPVRVQFSVPVAFALGNEK